MKRSVSFAFTYLCALFVFTALASAQQLDIAVGGSTLYSSKSSTASVGYLPPAEKGGAFLDASVQYTLANHFGLNAEGSIRYKKGLYDGFQRFRPIFYDVNAVYAPRIRDDIGADFSAGIGGETLLFYNQFGTCSVVGGGCRIFINSNHYLAHLGGDVRYYFWRNFFARPEVHWYFIPNNFEFHSRSVFRLGVSIGHSWGSR